MRQSKPATYHDLTGLLEQLGFQRESVEGSHHAFRHRASEKLRELARNALRKKHYTEGA